MTRKYERPPTKNRSGRHGRFDEWDEGGGTYPGRSGPLISGPRPDGSIRQDLFKMLRLDRRLDLREVKIYVKNSAIFLEGHVTSKRQMQILEDMASIVPGAEQVHNRLRVHRHPGI